MHISEARISDFRIIDQLAASFGPGLNVITGETGAGKTILVGAIGFALGERATRDVLRQGADEAVVEVVLEIGPTERSSRVEARLREELLALLAGLVDPDDDIVVLKRSMRRDGRGKSYVNYRPVPLSVLQRIGELVVDFHGQHEHQRLFSTRYQLLTLDEFGGLSDARNEVTRLYERFKELDAQVRSAESANRRADDERELLEFYVQELEQLRMTENEFESLQDERRRLANAEKLAELYASADHLLWRAPRSVCESLSTLERQMIAGTKMDDAMTTIADRVADARLSLEEVAGEARALADSLSFDPDRLEVVEDRLAALSSLARKHHCGADDLLSKLDEFREQLAGFEHKGEQLRHLKEQRDVLGDALQQKAGQLSKDRQGRAKELSAAVRGNLTRLAMQACDFGVDFAVRATSGDDEGSQLPGKDGFDRVEFVISTNPGQPLMPLRKVASGGEISRVMLTLKTALAGADDVPIMVFDELDAGIGGTAGVHVGRMLRRLAGSRQVLVVSHLVQIARFAQKHLSVVKEASDSGVSVAVTELGREPRINELARMLGGEGKEDAHGFAASLLADLDADR